MRAQSAEGAVWAVAALAILSACGGSPDRPSTDAPSDVPGATRVTGTERMSWGQPDYAAGMTFRAYVDASPVTLDGASCNEATPEAECSSPLPAMTDGVHTITLAAISGEGLEGAQSPPLTVQKVSARSVVSAVRFPDAHVLPGASQPDAVVTTSGGLSFTTDVVARGLKGPLQLAPTPDGRLLIADADARVRVIRPGEAEHGDLALDARELLQPPPAGGLGLAVHPDFARNHFVYVSFLTRDGAERTVLRIVRLREVGDTLGEPLTLFEARAVVGSQPTHVTGDPESGRSGAWLEAPRLAFGPDGLLYTLLPLGVEFDGEAAASRPHASMLRLSDEGRVPDGEPLSGIAAHPLGLAWHPSTAALWLIVPGVNGDAMVRPSTGEPMSGSLDAGPGVLRMTEDAGPSSGALLFQAAGTLALAGAFPHGIDPESIGTLRLAVPILAEGLLTGLSDRFIDMAPAGGGTLYLATSNPGDADATSRSGADVVLRLRPR